MGDQKEGRGKTGKCSGALKIFTDGKVVYDDTSRKKSHILICHFAKCGQCLFEYYWQVSEDVTKEEMLCVHM